ncbi:MAG: threonine aldolase, partial [Pseudonocardia sp.]|nr:threonine aldolase [Pseudonocardia sp.]
GVIAQQAALRTWTDTTRTPTVALHRLSHLDLDESNAIERLHPIAAIRLGTTQPFTTEDLDDATEPIGAVTVELPLRRAGFALLDWDELTAISAWCRQRSIPLHLDGARLWESAPFYGRPLAEIAALADSVYVSFYKGLDGMAGCALAGPEDFLARATPWLSRHGANIHTVFPYALAAAHGLDVHLPRMPEYAARARTLSAAIRRLPGVHGREPRTNSFAVHLPGDATRLEVAHRALARRTRTWLFNGFTASAVPGLTTVEVQVGAATQHIPDGEAAALTAQLVADAGAAAE